MHRVSVGLLCALTVVSLAFAQSDTPGSKDYPGITRMPGYYINEYKEAQFDSAAFKVTTNGKSTDQQIEGHLINITYRIKKNTPATSMLQVIRNYQNAARSAGGQVLDDTKGGNWYNTTLRLAKTGKEVWILFEARDDAHSLTIVERQAMQQDVVIDAAGMANGLSTNGSISLYGIYFDTAKSDLKPESEPTLSEIAKLLKGNAALKVAVVGHTDMVGDPAANLKLSLARGQSVINALAAKYGIVASRLTPFGNGPYAPVASNKTDEGRAKNRRVELVEFATR
ncbi:MAG: OmpA family protein [Bryobacteraceae bacterium]|jgi:outer membrane protein OmpA-like peptidoglycan-associated protein